MVVMKFKCKLCDDTISNNQECKCQTIKIKNNIIQINTKKHIFSTYYDFITELKGGNNGNNS